MATERLSDKALVQTLADNDSVVVVLANGNNRRISVEKLKTLWEWTGTQAEYDALQTYDANTTYYIVEAVT